MLTLPEELLLLSLDDAGQAHGAPAAHIELGLLACTILELELRGRVSIGATVQLLDGSPTGDRALDEVIELLAAMRDETRSFEIILTGAMNKLGWLRERVLDGLVAKDVVSHAEERILWLIPQHRYSVEHGAEEESLLRRILRVLLLGQDPDRRTSLLLAVLAACFTSDTHLRERLFMDMRDRMYEVVNSGGELQAATRDAVTIALVATAPPFVPLYSGKP